MAFPTDTFFALSCDPGNRHAVHRLRVLKHSDPARPLPLLVPPDFDVSRIGCRLTRLAQRLAERYWPGALTLVLPCDGELAAIVGRPADGAVGIRVGAPPTPNDLLSAWDGPLVATSANPSGKPPAVRPTEVRSYFGPAVAWVSRVPAVGGSPSTVVAVVGDRIEVLREGAIPASAVMDPSS